jgi:hypothetical protein
VFCLKCVISIIWVPCDHRKRSLTLICLQDDEAGGELREMCGFDYAMDLVSEMELAPAFPVVKNAFLVSGKKGNRLPKVGTKLASL